MTSFFVFRSHSRVVFSFTRRTIDGGDELIATMNTVDAPVPVSPEIDNADAENPSSDPAHPEMSQRERIRARLREKESRLTTLIRNSSISGGDGYASKVESVRSSLKQVEAEKSELEKELDRLKKATGDDDFLKEKMAGIQEGFDKQVKKIQTLEEQVVYKNNEIEGLRVELVNKLRRIIELEFDLETHDVHYTEYAAVQFKLGEDALAEIKSNETLIQRYGNESFHSNGSGPGYAHKSVSPRRAQKLIFKLLNDLDSLEARYKEEKLQSTTNIEQIQLENEDLRAKIHILEQRVGEEGISGEESGLDSSDMHNVFVLRKRCETLEAKRTLYRREMERLHEEIKEMRKEASRDAKQAQTEIERLKLENQAIRSRMENHEKDKPASDDSVFNEYAAIEMRIQEYFEEIQQLEAGAEIKDRQISTLKRELKDLRAKEIAAGDIEKKPYPYSDFDARLLRSASAKHTKLFDDDRSGITEDSDISLVSDLQNQLHEAQQALVKKDQELVIERAKAASTAAGLLARITELSAPEPRVDSKKKKKSGKHVPLRFYL